ncbi:MAG: glucose-6-phosphate dehydrogenase, partial [Actinobacteria bacterium]|nr:glucose-6-phosphate dehydrogenase [Actinomycetota bacterium]
MPATTLANPLRAGPRLARVPEPSILVIFGGTGDLTSRKLLPALYNLALQRLLPPAFAVVGAGRTPMSDDQFRAELREAVATFSRTKPLNEEVWASFAERVRYVSTGSPEGYVDLARTLAALDLELGTQG